MNEITELFSTGDVHIVWTKDYLYVIRDEKITHRERLLETDKPPLRIKYES